MFTVLKYLAIVLAVASASVWATVQYENGVIAEIKLGYTTRDLQTTANSLKQFQSNATRINNAAGDYERAADDLQNRLNPILKDLKDAQHKAPLPIGCKPDAFRVRNLAAAVNAANAASARP